MLQTAHVWPILKWLVHVNCCWLLRRFGQLSKSGRSCRTTFDVVDTEYTQAVLIPLTQEGDYILPSFSISTTPLLIYLYRFCPRFLCCSLCVFFPAIVVSLKTEFDILVAFGVSAIVSSECVGCDSDELARTLPQLSHWTAPCLPRRI